jgi:hypothetical protein
VRSSTARSTSSVISMPTIFSIVTAISAIRAWWKDDRGHRCRRQGRVVLV